MPIRVKTGQVRLNKARRQTSLNVCDKVAAFTKLLCTKPAFVINKIHDEGTNVLAGGVNINHDDDGRVVVVIAKGGTQSLRDKLWLVPRLAAGGAKHICVWAPVVPTNACAASWS